MSSPLSQQHAFDATSDHPLNDPQYPRPDPRTGARLEPHGGSLMADLRSSRVSVTAPDNNVTQFYRLPSATGCATIYNSSSERIETLVGPVTRYTNPPAGSTQFPKSEVDHYFEIHHLGVAVQSFGSQKYNDELKRIVNAPGNKHVLRKSIHKEKTLYLSGHLGGIQMSNALHGYLVAASKPFRDLVDTELERASKQLSDAGDISRQVAEYEARKKSHGPTDMQTKLLLGRLREAERVHDGFRPVIQVLTELKHTPWYTGRWTAFWLEHGFVWPHSMV